MHFWQWKKPLPTPMPATAPDDPGPLFDGTDSGGTQPELAEQIESVANAPAWTDLAGSTYRGLIDAQVQREDGRKASFEARGMQIITSAGAIVTLLFGLAALATSAKDFKLTGSSEVAFAIALGLLLVAAVCGIATNIPLEYVEASTTRLSRVLEDRFWLGPTKIAQRRVAELEIAQLVVGRAANTLKGRLLIVGLVFEVLGVLAVAVGVMVILV